MPGCLRAFAPAGSGTADSRRRSTQVRKALLSGGLARCASAALSLISLPLAVRYLGPERYGAWALITTTAVWINLLDLGVANTLTNRISHAFATDDTSQAASAVSNAVFVTAAAALVAACACVFVWPHIDWITLFHLTATGIAADTRSTALAAALLTLLALPANVANKAFAGYQQLHIVNYVALAASAVGLLGLFLGIHLRLPMATLFVISPGCPILANIALAGWLFTAGKPCLRPRLRRLHLATMRGLLVSGWSYFAIQLSSLIVLSSDNVVIAHYLGAAEVTPYTVTWRLVALSTLLPSLLFPAMWPAYSEAWAKHDVAWMHQAFRSSLTAMVAMNVCFGALLIAIGRPLIRLWAGVAAVPGAQLLWLMALWSLISNVMAAQSCVLAAVGRVRKQAALSIVAALVNLAISISLVQRIGSKGVIAGTILSYVLVLVVPQTRMVLDVLRVPGASGTEASRRELRALGSVLRAQPGSE